MDPIKIVFTTDAQAALAGVAELRAGLAGQTEAVVADTGAQQQAADVMASAYGARERLTEADEKAERQVTQTAEKTRGGTRDLLAMGAGMIGVGGAMELGGMVLGVVVEKLDLFGEKAAEAAAKAEALALSTRAASIEAQKNAIATNEGQAALEQHTEGLEALRQGYENALEAMTAATALRREEAAAAAELASAEDALAMAKIAAREASGDITRAEAEQQRGELRIAALERETTARKELAAAAREEAAGRAALAETDAAQKESRAQQMEEAGKGLLDKETRAAKEKQLEAAKEKQAELEKLLEKLGGEANGDKAWLRWESWVGGREEVVRQAQSAIPKVSEKLKRSQEEQRNLTRDLNADEEARSRTGLGDAEGLDAEMSKLKAEVERLKKTAADARASAERAERVAAQEDKLLPLRKDAVTLGTEGQVKQAQDRAAQQEARREKEEEAARRKEEAAAAKEESRGGALEQAAASAGRAAAELRKRSAREMEMARRLAELEAVVAEMSRGR